MWVDTNADPSEAQGVGTTAPPPTDADFMQKMKVPGAAPPSGGGNRDTVDAANKPPAMGMTPNRFSRGKLKGSYLFTLVSFLVRK